MKGAILAHERGHAKAFFEYQKPLFESKITSLISKPKLTAEEKEVVKRAYAAAQQRSSEKMAGRIVIGVAGLLGIMLVVGCRYDVFNRCSGVVLVQVKSNGVSVANEQGCKAFLCRKHE